jgi:hypothetical protein
MKNNAFTGYMDLTKSDRMRSNTRLLPQELYHKQAMNTVHY